MKTNKLFNIKNLKINDYEHGGSRIYLEDQNGKRKLLCDTFSVDCKMDMKIKLAIISTIKKVLKGKKI